MRTTRRYTSAGSGYTTVPGTPNTAEPVPTPTPSVLTLESDGIAQERNDAAAQPPRAQKKSSKAAKPPATRRAPAATLAPGDDRGGQPRRCPSPGPAPVPEAILTRPRTGGGRPAHKYKAKLDLYARQYIKWVAATSPNMKAAEFTKNLCSKLEYSVPVWLMVRWGVAYLDVISKDDLTAAQAHGVIVNKGRPREPRGPARADGDGDANVAPAPPDADSISLGPPEHPPPYRLGVRPRQADLLHRVATLATISYHTSRPMPEALSMSPGPALEDIMTVYTLAPLVRRAALRLYSAIELVGTDDESDDMEVEPEPESRHPHSADVPAASGSRNVGHAQDRGGAARSPVRRSSRKAGRT